MSLVENFVIYDNFNTRDEYDDVPSINVDDWKRVGKPNRYDHIASRFGIKPIVELENVELIVRIPSGYSMKVVIKVSKLYRPTKEYFKIHSGASWLHWGDYSNNPNFESYWEVEYDIFEMSYELADFLNYIPVNEVD